MTGRAPERAHEDQADAVALVALAGRFPGARDVEEFWANLCAGVESITRFTGAQAVARGADPAIARHPRFVGAEALLEGVDRFDAGFFGYAPREAALMDPQHRLGLEVAWEAFDRAGYDPATIAAPVGAFLSASMSSYLVRNLLPDRALVALHGGFGLLIHNDKDFLPATVSHKLGLTGPSIAVGAACSSSLVAVHLACQSLIAGECDLALAGGVSLQVPQGQGYVFSEDAIYSPDGRCRPFDAGAAGTVGGSGAGVVLLKRLADAERDGDHVHALVLGSAVNNDGAARAGYTAPGVDGQCAVVREAQAVAGVSPDAFGYVEAHGTGTPLGDPVEVDALTRAFRHGTDRRGFCALGSVKSNIGHLDAAAGIAGLIKAALAVERATIPATLHFREPNPAIAFGDTPFEVARETREWPRTAGGPRCAGVSAFGIGGTNAHVVLAQAPPPEAPTAPGHHPLVLSARSAPALDAQVARLADHLRSEAAPLAGVSRTLAGRRAFPVRAAVVAADAASAAEALDGLGRREHPRTPGPAEPGARPLVMVFPGQGAEHAGMALDLWRSHGAFADHLERCRALLGPLGVDLGVLLDERAVTGGAAGAWLGDPANAVPALFAVEYALGRALSDWGLAPSLVLGHSLGEYAAAAIAGVMALPGALALVAARGRLQRALPPGAMLAVGVGEHALRRHLDPTVSLAAVNATGECVVSGTPEAVEKLRAALRAAGVATRALPPGRALHSPAAGAVAIGLRPLLDGIALSPPAIGFVSSVTGERAAPGVLTDRAYWAEHALRPVRFHEAAGRLLAGGDAIVLEVGPRATLAALLRRHPERRAAHAVIGCQPRDAREAGARALAEAVAGVWAEGGAVDWPAYVGERARRAPAPGYAFERARHWIDPPAAPDPPAAGGRLDAWLPGLVADLEPPPLPDPGLERSLDRLCASAAQAYVRTAGCRPGTVHAVDDVRERLAVLPAFAPFLDYLLAILAEEGVLRRDGGTVEFAPGAGLPPVGECARDVVAAHPDASGLVGLLVDCASAYPEALSTPGHALSVLYPDGRGDRLARAFGDGPDPRGIEPLLALLRALRDRLVASSARPLRILEVGAGSGRLTWELAAGAAGDVDYLATDIGPLFCRHLDREAARRGLPWVRTGVFDITRPPGPQGVRGGFDLVVALDVVHATPDVEASLRLLASLLAPGGTLAAVETTSTSRWLSMVWGLSEGWWASGEGACGGTPLRSAARWRAVADRIGAVSTAVVTAGEEAGAQAALVLVERGDAPDAAAVAPKRPDPATWGWRPAWRRARAADPAGPPAGQRCLVFSAGPTGDALAAALGARGFAVTVARPAGAPMPLDLGGAAVVVDPASGDYDGLLEAGGRPGCAFGWVVHAWCADPPPGALDARCAPASLSLGMHSLVALAQAYGRRGAARPLRLLAVTRAAVDVLGAELAHPVHATAHAAVAVIAGEYPSITATAVDLPPAHEAGALAAAAERVADELLGEADGPVVAHRGRHRWTPAYVPAPLTVGAREPRAPRPGGTYLVTGGLGGIGSALAAHLAALPADVVAVSRGAFPPRDGWRQWLRDPPDDRAGETVRRFLEAESAGGRVTVERADVCDTLALRAVVDAAVARSGPLTGVVHAAGVVDTGGMIQRRARGETDAAIAARVRGTLALREAIAGQHPDFVLLCSSIGTVLHKLKFGEVGYLASHAFLNAYAEAAAAAGEPVVAVAWTDWLETGMWAEAQQRLRERYAVTATGAGGLHPAADLLAGITTAEAVEVFDRIVGAGLSGAVVVSTQDLDVLLGRHEAFEAARHDVLAGDLRLRGTHRERPPLPTPHVPPAGATQAAVAALWTQLLGVRDPGADDDFFDLGGDSLLALRFLGRLREETGVDHPVARFFEAPTVRAVASAVEGAPAAGGAP